ncbi:MAG: hypothetical protein IJY39_08005 [Clostridia bacterium]|nr:hypothetical protein [Clostridia bacterium]
MEELVFKIFGVALIATMAVMLLKKWGADLAILVRIMAGIVLAGGCCLGLAPIISYLREVYETQATATYLTTLLRALCVAVLTHVCASVCRDCGEGTLANYVELGGKAEILMLALPLVREIIGIVTSLLETV